MIHSSYYQPRVYPYGGSGASAEIDRLQEFSGTVTTNREKINEIGRDGTVDWRKGIPSVALTLRQLEYGSIEFWRKLANKADSVTSITLNDFKTSVVDMAGFQTDDSGTFLGTVWYPKLRTNGWGINIGDPESLIERSFSLIGEDQISWSDSNKYLIYLESTATGTGHMIVIGSGGFATYPDPVNDPRSSGASQILRVVRIRAGVASELVITTDYTWSSSTNLLNIPASASGDLYKITYTAGSYITGGTPFTLNDTDLGGISADSCSIYLRVSNYVYRLQSVSVDVSLTREDVKEVGNSEVVQRGVKEKTVKITLGRILEDYTLERILIGAPASFGAYDVRNFQDDMTLSIYCYSDKDKGTFKIGYKFTNLSPTSTDIAVPTKDYVKAGTVLEGEEAIIASTTAELA